MVTHTAGTRALVLGGGGVTGIAWEIGVILGLFEGGVDVSNADLIVGTSAGATVGAQISSGLDVQALYALQWQLKERQVAVDLGALGQSLAAGAQAPNAQMARACIGALALSASTMSETERLEMIRAYLPVQEWSYRQQLMITAVDAQTGERVVFDRHTQVPLELAVAASRAVPGVYPPTTINGRRYIDGGIYSGTNADLARGSERVLILKVRGNADAQKIPRVSFDDELAALARTSSQVQVILPDEASAAARGPNSFDVRRRALAAQVGRAQGYALAEQVKLFWEGKQEAEREGAGNTW